MCNAGFSYIIGIAPHKKPYYKRLNNAFVSIEWKGGPISCKLVPAVPSIPTACGARQKLRLRNYLI